MKRILIIFFLAIMYASLAFGQITKKEKVWGSAIMKRTLYAYFKYNQENELEKVNFLLLGQDLRYKHISKSFSIYYSNPIGFHDFILKCIDFLEKREKGTSTKIGNTSIAVVRSMGFTGIRIYGTDEDSSSYYDLSMTQLKNLKKKFTSFCKSKYIALE